ncbi:GNAT family N-acetyltransferase [Inhella proteolytica]|uniref:GNAT family N-acetyltransferase n=1 Tax=Inhella proteolytica TaxID=2795029 RepID=A0A931J4D0_9BURK|nr:GNAT family N-acetyltransferase [Inhella proteolytica]MBH9579384.1 GNAT family N-acetyltransferase [Inhella proteolytica]
MLNHSLQTPRLLLRPWRDDDLAPYAALNADPEVMRHFPALLSREESDAQAARIRAKLDAQGWGLWAVEVKGGPAFIGFVGLAVPGFEAPFMPATEIGWRLARSAWGQGYASEAARAALGFGFTELGLEAIVSFTAVGNQRSRAVMERIGMQNTGQDFEHPRVPEGSPLRRHVLYRLARRDWLAA